MKTTWADDWTVFIETIEHQIREEATTEKLQEFFGGQKVRWVGTVDAVDLDELAPGVDLNMEEIRVDVGENQTAIVDGLYLPVTGSAIRDWNAVKPGDCVFFEATLGAGNAPFPPIEVETLNSGRRLLVIRVTNGQLIERLESLQKT